MHYWTDQELLILKEYYCQGKDIILTLIKNRSWDTIRRKASYLKLCNNLSWSEEEEIILRENYGKISISQIIKKGLLSRSRESIKAHARLLKLNGNRLEMISFVRRIPVLDNFFTIPDLENSYWAGFIAADGCIHTKSNRISIMLADKDIQHLLLLKEKICPVHNLLKYKTYISLKFSSIKIKNDLKQNYSITERKSLTLKPPKNLSTVNSLAFIIGYIDGDGCIRINKEHKIEISILGTQELLIWLKSYLDMISPITVRSNPSVRKVKNIYRYKITGKRAISILNTLNKINVPKLGRKWDKVL